MNPRTLLLVGAVAASVAVPALAEQQPESLRLGAAIGTESSSPYAGIGLRLDLEIPGASLGPRGGYSWVVSLGYAHMGETRTNFWSDATEKWRIDITKVVPAFRLFVEPTQRLRLYADGGVGAYRANYLYEATDLYFGTVQRIEFEDTSVLFRFAAGIGFALKPSFSLGGELGFTSYLGDMDATTFNGLVTVTWKL